MGKHRHTQDKLHITQKEHIQDWGGKREEHTQNKIDAA